MSKPNLKVVDKLTITFLVDNNIEWMTKLPPGFTHEINQHIRQSPPDETTGVPILDFDNFCCGAHGFSALLETQVNDEKPHLTLFDTGPDSLSLVRNIEALRVPTYDIERVITSHWHSDHTGGLLSFLRLRDAQQKQQQASQQFASEAQPGSGGGGAGAVSQCIIDVHPDRPLLRGIAPGPTFDKVICAIPRDPTFSQIEELGGVLERHAEGHVVAGGAVWVSGEIPRVTEWEQGKPGGMRWVEGEGPNGRGEWVTEQHIMDERYAAVDVAGKGLVLFSACSHAGIVNVVKDAITTFSRPVYMIIGGLHLAGPEFVPRLQPTVDFLSKQLRPAPAYVLPMHCSGFRTKVALEAALGEGCVPAGVGHRVEVIGNQADESHLFPPVY
ncbi:hypothetical protein AMATHDRAFT_75304 [Amanita thiersii Skay4041]|uniref:Metallo-beta-lactamase domain-containing protein n=1 Tax=Amanita thiersii Skay4041 TaxID=703135 RepID=A0A2A9NIU7_9AGAR|nr:hypothetical protein AMATHDRAFT_75304 [Amanita thiersii Skay4041]